MSGTMIVIIAVSVLLPIALIAVIMTALVKSQAKTDELLRTGTPARGRITGLGTTGTSVAVMGHRHLKLVLTVEVQPQAGAPYVAQFEQLVSELQIPSVQPGAIVDLRIDPMNPMRMAMAGVVPPGMQGMQSPGMHGGMQGGWPQPAQPMMGVGVMQPNYKSALPMIIVITLVTTVPVAVILGYVFVDWGAMFGSSDEEASSDETAEQDSEPKKRKKKGGVCAKAAACCKVISGSNASACDNFDSGMMPVEGCRQALDGYERSAKAMGKSCD